MAIAKIKPVAPIEFNGQVLSVNGDFNEWVFYTDADGGSVDSGDAPELYTRDAVFNILLKYDYWLRNGGSGFVTDFMAESEEK